MRYSSVVESVFFWLMLLAGAASLAPCLVLPAWLERQAHLSCLAAHQKYVADLRYRLQSARKQIEHLENDPAYLLRLAEHDLGGLLKVPNVRTIPVDPGTPLEQAGQAEADAPSVTEDELIPELSSALAELVRRCPRVDMFVNPETRPVIMVMGATLLAAAILLLGLPSQRWRKADTADGG